MPHIPQFSPPSSSSSRKSTAFSSSSFRNIFSSLRNSSSSSPSSSTWKKSSSSSSSLFQNPKRVSRYKRRLFLWIITLLLSCAFFYAFLSLGILTFFFPSAFSLTPQALLLDLTIGEVREFHSLLKGKPLPRHEDKTSIDASAVLVGPHGTVKAPYSRVIDHLLKIATLPLLTGEVEAYRTGDDFSIIIPVRNEEAYLPKTMRYLFDITPPERIREVIVVDDFSDTPIEQILRADLPSYMLHKTKFIRFDSPQGLIRGRVAGASIAASDNLFFLDGHCRPKKGWAEPLLHHLQINYKRIACPKIYDIYADTWEDVGTHGTKMMFEWTFEFGWFEDLEDEIPLLSGGILAITKKWWIESGQYDEGMLEWGGENLEQSIRAWMCGGEIVASHESKIGHIFARPPKPNPENRLVIQVQKNQKRAAKVWLDEYYFLFYKYHPEVRGHEEGDISSRIRLRYEHLTCMPFQWYVEKFRTAFDRNNLLDHNFFHIQHSQTGLCLSSAASPAMPEERLVLEPCSRETRRQRWSIVAGNRMLANREKKCIDAYVGRASLRTPLTWKCDWHSVIQGLSINQLWQWDLGREEEEDRLSFLEGKNEEEEGKMKETMNDLTHTSSSSSSITGLPGSPTDKRELNKKTKRKGRDHPPLMPRQPSGVSSLSTGRIFSFSHPDTLSLTGHDTIPIFRHFAVSDRSRCLVVDEDDEEYLRFEESRKKKIETSRKIPVRWKACNGVPIVKGKKKKDPLVSRQKNEEKDTLAKEDREKEKKKKEEEEEEEEEMVVDPMRFVPLWMLPPLSSRFGKRTLSQALTITDEAAAIYLKSPPQYID